jgi:hypothetical protein
MLVFDETVFNQPSEQPITVMRVFDEGIGGPVPLVPRTRRARREGARRRRGACWRAR